MYPRLFVVVVFIPIHLSFRGASKASEPGIHNLQRCGVWIPGPSLRAVPE
jgi:hypothetical protein